MYTLVPGDFQEVLGTLTQHGYRVLGVGHRPLHMAWHKAERVKRYIHVCLFQWVWSWTVPIMECREVVERDLTFAGLVVMQNRLKSETTPAITTLTQAKIRSVMITGMSCDSGISPVMCISVLYQVTTS